MSLFKRRQVEPREEPSEQSEQYLSLLNMLAKVPLTVGTTAPGRVVVFAEFDQAEFESRVGVTLPAANHPERSHQS